MKTADNPNKGGFVLTKDYKTLKSAERRNFLKLAGSGSFTAAMVAGGAGMLWSTEAIAQTAKEEKEREAAADALGNGHNIWRDASPFMGE